jgi:hypothetical protein
VLFSVDEHLKQWLFFAANSRVYPGQDAFHEAIEWLASIAGTLNYNSREWNNIIYYLYEVCLDNVKCQEAVKKLEDATDEHTEDDEDSDEDEGSSDDESDDDEEDKGSDDDDENAIRISF